MNTLKIDATARKLCTHTVVFTDAASRRAVAMAMQGMSTKAIAKALGITLSEAQYRISKAQKSMRTRFRQDYRNSSSPLAKQMMQVTEKLALQTVDRDIAPKFVPFARQGVSRKA